MPRLNLQVAASLALAVGLVAAPSQAGGCTAPVAVTNSRLGGPGAGGFDFAPVPVEKVPALRFWAFGSYGEMNSGTQDQNRSPEAAWLSNPNLTFAIKEASPTVWGYFQASWTGPNIHGCIMSKEPQDRRTVTELSLSDPKAEGTVAHRGFYAISSVDFADTQFDFDRVRGASGTSGNVVSLAPIPAPRVVSVKAAAPGFQEVEVELAPAPSYSEGGKDAPLALVQGYRLLYASGAEPTTSDPAAYKPVLDAKDPKKSLACLAPGTIKVTVPENAGWLVAQLVYKDPSELLSNVTSGHVAVQAGAGSGRARTGGRSRGKE